MKIIYLSFATPDDKYLTTGCEIYRNRIPHYNAFNHEIIPALKNTKSLSENQQKEKEGEIILSKIVDSDYVVLLDELGIQYTSVDFSKFVQQRMLSGIKRVLFITGGPYGFSDAIYNRGNSKLALSKMTFSHQMVQLIFLEQLYRALTILKNEPYHH
ncbi:MAG: 23S rRNA (pseudouridine(1915)-N(3))-methyltransferase RlmH [Bacteroidota bacterium]|jgi:23S rRNA (pseudouridine1915-N3)-methyltransferase